MCQKARRIVQHSEIVKIHSDKVLKTQKYLSIVVEKNPKNQENPLRAILLWVKIWVRRFHAEMQNLYSNFLLVKAKEKVLKSYDFRTFYGCGGRTRTYDLRVMSPTSFQLLYSAIFTAISDSLGIIPQGIPFVNSLFPNPGTPSESASVTYILPIFPFVYTPNRCLPISGHNSG